MPEHRMIEGDVLVDDSSREAWQRVTALEDENADLRTELAAARLETQRARQATDRALQALRRQLAPLYKALQQVFGELAAAGVDEETAAQPGAATAGVNPRHAAVWASWKTKLGPVTARFIDALLIHGEMNVAQLKVTCQCGTQTVYDHMKKLSDVGLINKANRGKYSLKALP